MTNQSDNISIRLFAVMYLLVLLPGLNIAQRLNQNQAHLWKPAPDDVYLQEVGQKILTDKAVQAISVYENKCFVVMEGNIFLMVGNKLTPQKNAPTGVERLLTMNGDLWALTDNGIFRSKGNKWEKIDDKKYVDLCMHDGVLYGATSEEIDRFENDHFVNIKPKGGYYSSDITMLMEDGTQIHADPVRLGPYRADCIL